MPCYHPIPLYRSKHGPNPKTGKVPLVGYSRGKGRVDVPCGSCIGCRLEKSRQWAGRIMAESQLHSDNVFLTLTYRDEELTYGGAEHGILVPEHLERFWKRLRKWVAKHYGRNKRISYYACGEYGDKSRRPHYHSCLFGIDFPDKKFHSYTDGNYLYTSVTLDNLWSHGMCTIGSLTFESAAYVARYCLKKRLGNTKGTYEQEGITPEFARMSRRPAIGAEWFRRFHRDVFPSDTFVIRDFPSKPPRYFMDLYDRLDPTLAAAVREQRAKLAEANWEENEPKRLRIRERVKKSQTKTLTRKLD